MTPAQEFYLLILALAALGLLIIAVGWVLIWDAETPRVEVDPADVVYDWSADAWAELDQEAS